MKGYPKGSIEVPPVGGTILVVAKIILIYSTNKRLPTPCCRGDSLGGNVCLKQIFPKTEIEAEIQYPIKYTEFTLESIHELIKDEPRLVHSACLRVWDRVITASRIQVDPMMLASHVNEQDPWMFLQITNVVGEDVFKKLYFVRAEVIDKTIDYKIAAQLAVAQSFPNDLLLIDLLMSNPYKLIEETKRKSHLHKYRGYGLLGTVFQNAKSCAQKLGCNSVVLTAATGTLVPLFEQYGFNVDNTPTGLMGHQLGVSIPMSMRVVRG